MIIPSPSSDKEDQDQTLPPSYQEAVLPSQRLPRELSSGSLYAPSVSSRSGPPRERERQSRPNPDYPDGRGTTKRSSSDPPPPPPKDKGSPTQGAFASTVWGATPAASSSRSSNPASAGHSSATQDPLNPAPDAFTRPTPKTYAYLPFHPMTMLGISSNLAEGFLLIPPPINSEDEGGAGKANAQHPFVSHDVTEDDWVKFLSGIKTVASAEGQAPKSFWTRMFVGEMSEKDRRKRAIHLINSWNHYFFQPRRMTVVLARGRRIYGGASGHHHRRHSAGHERGRDANSTQRGDHRNRPRSHSTDSSSSDSSGSSSSSIRSTVSEPPEMPVPHTREPPSGKLTKGPSKEHQPWLMANAHHALTYGYQYAQFSLRGPPRGMGRGGGRGYGGWDGSRGYGRGGGRGRYPQGVPGPSMPLTAGGSEGEEPREFPTHLDQKLAWKAMQDEWKREWKSEKKAWKTERRGMKYEHRRMKRAMRHEHRQRKMEARSMRYGGEHHGGVKPWKLIISYHGTRGEIGQS